MNREQRKQWILEHQDVFLEFGRQEALDSYNHLQDLYEKYTGKKYDKEEALKNGITTVEDAYAKNLAEGQDINFHLNNKKLINSKESKCEEEINGIDLSEYLKEIRYDHYKEHMMFLFIRRGKIVDKVIINGISNVIRITPYMKRKMIKRAKELKANLYQVHNHPSTFTAYSSDVDEETRKIMNDTLKTEGIKLLDWGVVTEWDYYSYKQKGFTPTSRQK